MLLGQRVLAVYRTIVHGRMKSWSFGGMASVSGHHRTLEVCCPPRTQGRRAVEGLN